MTTGTFNSSGDEYYLDTKKKKKKKDLEESSLEMKKFLNLSWR